MIRRRIKPRTLLRRGRIAKHDQYIGYFPGIDRGKATRLPPPGAIKFRATLIKRSRLKLKITPIELERKRCFMKNLRKRYGK